MTEFDPAAPVINSSAVDHWCFGCGNLNEHGLQLRFRAHGSQAVWADFTPAHGQEGYLGMTHGGILATVLDEAMSWAITHTGAFGVTARMSVTYRNPARIGSPVRVIGEVLRMRSRTVETRAEIREVASDALIAGAEGRFVLVSPEQAAEWRAAYGVGPNGSAS